MFVWVSVCALCTYKCNLIYHYYTLFMYFMKWYWNYILLYLSIILSHPFIFKLRNFLIYIIFLKCLVNDSLNCFMFISYEYIYVKIWICTYIRSVLKSITIDARHKIEFNRFHYERGCCQTVFDNLMMKWNVSISFPFSLLSSTSHNYANIYSFFLSMPSQLNE